VSCGGTPPATSSATPAAGGPSAQPARVALKVNWTALTGANSGLWTAFEAGYFADEALDVELVNINSSSRSIAALVAKEVQIAAADVGNIVDVVVGGGNVKAIHSVTNRLIFSVMGQPGIGKVADLKGKKIGITTPGSSTHTAGLEALRLAGLKESDVTFVSLTEVPNILAALTAKQIDAGVVSPPTNSRARAAGFTEVINLATDGPDFPSVCMAATGEYIAANPDVVKRFVKAYSRGVVRFRSDKVFGMTAINKYLKLDDKAVLEDTWTQFSKYIEVPPLVRGLDVVIASRGDKAKAVTAQQIFDDRFVKQLETEGFFKDLK
jgi:NitT/TauT family transport system substrate-binding protein